MPENRIIPAVESVAEFKIMVDGVELPRTVEVVSVYVSKVVNKISMAKFVIKDGDVADSNFPLSNGSLFIPGKEIVISAGSPEKQTNVFSGIIIKHSIAIRGNVTAKLVVECKHIAVKATIVKRSNCFHDKTDDAVITEVLKESGFRNTELDIAATSVTYQEMVQYHCTDWDFAVSRAEISGQIVLTNEDKIVVKAPDFNAGASLSLLYGATIIELDAEIDCRSQYKSVKAKSWDMASQALAEAVGNEPFLAAFGNLDGTTLSDVGGQEEYVLQHAGALNAAEIKMWADAQLLKSRMAKIRGRVKFEGIASINPGDMLELYGLGDRFSGNAFVSGVRHDYTASEGWKTQAQFGNTPDWFIDENDITSAKAGGLLPGTVGLHTGIVTDNEDPDGEFRIRVKMPFINPDDDGVWARVALADAGKDRGMFFRPEITDEVLVGFLYDDPRQPVVLGMLHSSSLPAPLTPSNDNHQKGFTSREKLILVFDDDKKSICVETPGGNKITLSDDAKGITLEDQNGNKISMDDKGILIHATKKLELTAGSELVIGAPNLKISADAAMELKGGSTKIESSGMVNIKGAMVNIN